MGFPFALFDEMPSKLDVLSCSICNEVLEDAVFPCANQHVICRIHFKALQGSQPREAPAAANCRECGSKLFETPETAHCFSTRVDKLPRRCAYAGCTFSSARIDDHQTICEYRTAPCENVGCDEHIKMALSQDHADTCRFAVLSCLRGRCPVSFLRKDAQKHDDECTSYCCSYYEEDGCPYISTKAALEEHVAYCKRIHDQLAGYKADLAKKEAKINKMREDRSILQRENLILQGKYRVASRRNSVMEAPFAGPSGLDHQALHDASRRSTTPYTRSL